MYKNVDEVLRDIYRFGALRIEPLNNTAQVCQWIENKGVSGSKSSLTQAEWHANAAMIQSRIERVLNRFELAAVELQYTGGLKADGIVDLTAFIEQENRGVNLLICDDLLSHIFCGMRQEAIQDKYDLSRKTIYNQKKKVKDIVSALLNSAICKLEDDFLLSGVIQKVA